MLKRTDNKKIPLGLIPGGSGNSYLNDLKLTFSIQLNNEHCLYMPDLIVRFFEKD